MQLADGTHLTLDETTLQAGTLNAVGVQNVEVLKHLLQWQKVGHIAAVIEVLTRFMLLIGEGCAHKSSSWNVHKLSGRQFK